MKPYSQKDLMKSRDMSYLSRCFIDKKEYIETSETLDKSIQIVRDYYKIDRLDTIVDFCSGHTFNACFALSRNYSKYVWCIDLRFPISADKLQSYYQKFVPRMMLRQENIFLHDYKIPQYSMVLSVHSCRDLPYRVAEIAIQNKLPVVIVPCCTGRNKRRSWIDEFPEINRYDRHSMKVAQFLEENNYEIKIKAINKNYTPRNNIIIGLPRIKVESDNMKPITPFLTVDVIIIYNGKIVLIKRANHPFQGQYALPGGFVDIGETVENAVIREAKEETGLDIDILTDVGIYSDPNRDPRGHTVSICYLALGHGELKSGSDAKNVELFEFDKLPKLSFDHDKMIEHAREIVKDIKKDYEEIKNN